ncbi:hypothetical protein [Gilvimarinus algae]|uniref:Cytochrome c-552/4 domain-containing protein n=1 Tax=Gilvimarinus algae TaxID=3058037 RepID=A0ABT8TL52_9GAMM|nr:hypothetical protein [Gilvimarinus sp. SDUM040014]MDO3383833.1 hypothetical protein [Gilvimarinus sp. SDUM040014]
MKPVHCLIFCLALAACSGDEEASNADTQITSNAQLAKTQTAASGYTNTGETIPKPVFQQGDTPSTPHADGSTAAQGFVDFFNKTYLTDEQAIPLLGKQDVVWFPPQRAGDTSLELVARLTQGKTENCDSPDSYPIYCENDFSTGEFCQSCHDSALFVEGGGLPQMSYFSEAYSKEKHDVWLANWSQYGDWNTSIMRLATRDPIWQAQIETETNRHPYADPAVIQDVCFSCHGEMGERQLKFDHGMDQTYCTDLFYATIPGYLPSEGRGKPYPFSGVCEPIEGKPIAEHQALYAKYGSLARDGISCETCHRIGPEGKAGQWSGTDFEVFYGPKDKYQVAQRQTENPVPLEYEFTATFDYDMDNVLTPDTLASLDAQPMKNDDNLEIAHAYNQKDGLSYLRQSVICGTCHVLIVPEIPTAFKPGAPLPDASQYPYYKKPEACTGDSFAPATNGKYGNPVTDPCVALGYEQATYLEWINSSFASEEDNEHTCQGCHMPLVTDPDNPSDHTAIMAQSTPGLSPKDYRRHRLMGINLPVLEMFVQFPDVLGVATVDDTVPPEGVAANGKEAPFIQNYLLNGQMAIIQQATSQANGNGLQKDSTTPDPQAAAEITIDGLIVDEQHLTADLSVTNNTGHKFPSGAGFRRAFLKFEVLDNAGSVVWVSGQTNPYGAICQGPCVKGSDGTYNLLASEVTGGDPKKLQPHHQLITSNSQVQIYEVQAVDDTGTLTSRTLSLFFDAKDNRLLPKGFTLPSTLGCDTNPDAGRSIFGLKQCSAAYATEPQRDPLTVGSAIASDAHYSDPALAGSDTIRYQIPRSAIGGTPESIRVTMEYQTIPPAFLAARFSDGHVTGSGFLPATERAIYLTSHLNMDLPLKSEHPDNTDLQFSQNWTSSLYQASATVGAAQTVQCKVFNDGYSNITAASDAIYLNSGSAACVPDGTGKGNCRKWFGRCTTSAGEAVNLKVFNAGGANATAASDAVYAPQPNQACVPDGSSRGNCRSQFGMAHASSGAAVSCRLFNDGYTDITGPAESFVFASNGRICMANNASVCRKWFGRCQVSE